MQKRREILSFIPAHSLNMTARPITTAERMEEILRDIEEVNKLEHKFFSHKSPYTQWSGHVWNIAFRNVKLQTLPESFGGIVIRGSIILKDVSLETLPESFGDIVVGGTLDLSNNNLMRLPDSFGMLNMGWTYSTSGNGDGHLELSNNKLTSLPESFGNIHVGGAIFSLSNNRLRSLPESFGNIVVGETINLKNNKFSNEVALPRIRSLKGERTVVYMDDRYVRGDGTAHGVLGFVLL